MSGRGRAGYGADWRYAEAIIVPVLAVAPSSFLIDLRSSLQSAGVCEAVARRDRAPIFDWMVPLIQLQGISDAIALSYIKSRRQTGIKAHARQALGTDQRNDINLTIRGNIASVPDEKHAIT